MQKNNPKHFIIGASTLLIVGFIFLRPLMLMSSNIYATEKLRSTEIVVEEKALELNLSYNNDPLESFINFRGIESPDIELFQEVQKNRTIAEINLEVKAKGPHKLYCAFDEQVDDIGMKIRSREVDELIKIVSYEDAWFYRPNEIGIRGQWPIDIPQEAYEQCETGRLFWGVSLQLEMPNGTIRLADEFYSNIFEIIE